MTTKLRLLICIPLLIAGLAVLAWPEEDNLMMVQFSKSHGPSGLDVVGIAIIFMGYIPLIFPVFKRFGVVQLALGRVTARLLILVVTIFSMLIVAGLVLENELLLWSSVVVISSAQAVLIYAALKGGAGT
jgi:hypothetical protein